MNTHNDDTCPHLVRANLLEAENARQVADRIRVNANSVHTAARRCGVRLAPGSKEAAR